MKHKYPACVAQLFYHCRPTLTLTPVISCYLRECLPVQKFLLPALFFFGLGCVCVVVFVQGIRLIVPQANVMLEYPIDAAEQLLSRNLTQAESSLRQVDQDMDHIRDQCTTLEVGRCKL